MEKPAASAPNMMDASSRWLWTTPFLPPSSEVKSREKKERFSTSIPCTNIWEIGVCCREGNQDQNQSATLKLIVTNQTLWTEALSSWCALPKVKRKAPKAWIPKDPTKSLLPKPLNPPYLHIKPCLSVIITPNCRSGKKPIISRLCLLVDAVNEQLQGESLTKKTWQANITVVRIHPGL